MNDEQRFIGYLESVKPPEIESPHHRQFLRRELLNEIERRRKMASRKRRLKIIYIVAALVCLSALAFAGVKYARKWHFVGEKDGSYIFKTEPKEVNIEVNGRNYAVGVHTSSSVIMNSESKEQAEQDLTEIEELRAEGKRELLDVIEKKLDNGQTIKVYKYKYVLSDGREIIMNEGTNADERTPEEIKVDLQKRFEQKWKEREEKVRRARQEGKRGEISMAAEMEIGGKIFTKYLVKYKMPDGSEVDVEEGDDLEKELEAFAGKEIDQLAEDIIDNKGESLGAEEKEIEGRQFTFRRQKYKLSDGREIICSEGTPSE